MPSPAVSLFGPNPTSLKDLESQEKANQTVRNAEKKIDEQWPLLDVDGSGKLGKDKIKELILKIKLFFEHFDDQIFDEAYSSFKSLVDGDMPKESACTFYLTLLNKQQIRMLGVLWPK